MLRGRNLIALRVCTAVMVLLLALAVRYSPAPDTGTGTAESASGGSAGPDEETMTGDRENTGIWNQITERLETAEQRQRPAVDAAAEEYRMRKKQAEKRVQMLTARIRSTSEASGEELLWDSFSDAVILGDSRATGFSIYGYLPESRVLAETSANIRAAEDHLDSAREAAPNRIYVSYGINDVATGLWSTPEAYADEVLNCVRMLQEQCPDAMICINSIFPASPEACEARPLWNVLPSYSEAIRKACADHNICYIDNTPLAEAHWDMYAGDGIHFSSEFYKLWAQNMLQTADRFEIGMLSGN